MLDRICNEMLEWRLENEGAFKSKICNSIHLSRYNFSKCYEVLFEKWEKRVKVFA